MHSHVAGCPTGSGEATFTLVFHCTIVLNRKYKIWKTAKITNLCIWALEWLLTVGPKPPYLFKLKEDDQVKMADFNFIYLATFMVRQQGQVLKPSWGRSCKDLVWDMAIGHVDALRPVCCIWMFICLCCRNEMNCGALYLGFEDGFEHWAQAEQTCAAATRGILAKHKLGRVMYQLWW